MGYSCTVSCRMTDEDRRLLAEQAGKLGLSPSDYLRYIIRIPVAAKEGDGAVRCVVIDASAMEDLASELTKWGYHYNQAVHAMNTIALFIRRGRVEYEFFEKTIESIGAELAGVNAACVELQEAVGRIEESVLVGGRICPS